ncbi:MAG: hypothetical protein ACM3KR_01765 [Deltaproteobacteria bacterium]
MDFEDIFYNLKHKRFGGRLFKIVLAGFLFIVAAIVILLITSIILAMNYHTQIYDGFMQIVNFIFGDSPENVIRGYLQQIADNFFKNLFNGN